MGKWKNGKMGENGGKILCLQLQHATCCNIQFAYLTRLRSINSTRTTYIYLSSICICIYTIYLFQFIYIDCPKIYLFQPQFAVA